MVNNVNAGIVKLSTGVESLDDLLGGGIFVDRRCGFFGVITGATGTGKSILGLELCTKFVLSESESKKPRSAVYVYTSQESPQLLKTKISKAFNFFVPKKRPTNESEEPVIVIAPDQSDAEDASSPLVRSSSPRPGCITELRKYIDETAAIYMCQIGLDRGSQRATLENIVQIVARTIAGFSSPDEHWDRILLCIDSVNTIDEEVLMDAMMLEQHNADSSAAPEVEGRSSATMQTSIDRSTRSSDPTFYRRLREHCSKLRVHTFLIFEERYSERLDSEKSDISTTPEAYAADIVLRLGVHTYESSYRQRFIEIVKAKNQFYYRGRHHFSIVSEQEDGGGGDRPPINEVGLVIYPSVAAQLAWLRDEERKEKEELGNGTKQRPAQYQQLGIESLDQRIANFIQPIREKGASQQDSKVATSANGYIVQGSSSVLVSDLDVKATEIGLHFAFRGERSLFVSFLHEVDDLKRIAGRFICLKHKLTSEKHILKYYSPEHISEGKLLRDIDLDIKHAQGNTDEPLVVVVDNVFELECKYPLLISAKHFLAALLELFRVRRATSLVIDTVEVGEAGNPIQFSFAAGLADNVFLLRHVEFHSRPHHVFSVLKLLGTHTPEVLWNLEENYTSGGSELVARDTFELYKHVLSGKPEPVTITLTVYMDAEGSPFQKYLQAYAKALEESFGSDVVVTNMYGAEEYARVQALITSARARQRSDCHIVHLDEFWLKQLIENQSLEELSEYIIRANLPSDFRDRTQYVSAAHDIVMYRITKDKALREKYGIDIKNRESLAQWYKRWYAIPARNNFGMLCCDPTLLRELMVGEQGHLPQKINAWLEGEREHGLTWTDIAGLKGLFDRKKSDRREHYPKVFFTFCMDQMESHVSFLLELMLSLGRRSDILDKGKLNFEKLPLEGFRTLLQLLDDSDIQTLASAVFRPSSQEPTALFSRQWMSTLGALRSRSDKDADGAYFSRLKPLELPLGPGKKEPTPVSGTWYLGILKGSVAVETGMRVIAQAASMADEVYKLNNYIGLPVRETFYRRSDRGGRSTPFPLPYRRRFADLADFQRELINPPHDDTDYVKEVLQGDYPFYRVLIDDYHLVAPVLWRLLVRMAGEAVAYGVAKAIQKRRIQNALNAAEAEYRALASGTKTPDCGPSVGSTKQGRVSNSRGNAK
ncbi:MAG: hypothetical protein AMJ75_03330 [Phycisphaerae bacterium SM1_79]|nr:MAG: hypothetical protein AMJ75_03330 [Phycisphaerae bacterium SM1_79]